MRRERKDPYIVLGVGRQASASEIARAYRQAARATHPDSRAGGAGSAEGFQAVSDAYETLRDPRRRAAYDSAHAAVRPGATAALRVSGRNIVLGGGPRPAPPVRAQDAADDGAALLARLVLSLLRSSR